MKKPQNNSYRIVLTVGHTTYISAHEPVSIGGVRSALDDFFYRVVGLDYHSDDLADVLAEKLQKNGEVKAYSKSGITIEVFRYKP